MVAAVDSLDRTWGRASLHCRQVSAEATPDLRIGSGGGWQREAPNGRTGDGSDSRSDQSLGQNLK